MPIQIQPWIWLIWIKWVNRTIEFQKSYSFTILKSTFESSIDRKHEAKKTTRFTEFVCPYKTFKQLILFCCVVFFLKYNCGLLNFLSWDANWPALVLWNIFLLCYPQSIGEIMRKFGSPSSRFSSMIMLGILLHKLNLNYGALIWLITRCNGR